MQFRTIYPLKLFYFVNFRFLFKAENSVLIENPANVNAKVKMQENAEEILHVFDEKIY